MKGFDRSYWVAAVDTGDVWYVAVGSSAKNREWHYIICVGPYFTYLVRSIIHDVLSFLDKSNSSGKKALSDGTTDTIFFTETIALIMTMKTLKQFLLRSITRSIFRRVCPIKIEDVTRAP